MSGIPEATSALRELRDLIRRMSGENFLWGAPRIHGELLRTILERMKSRFLDRSRQQNGAVKSFEKTQNFEKTQEPSRVRQ